MRKNTLCAESIFNPLLLGGGALSSDLDMRGRESQDGRVTPPRPQHCSRGSPGLEACGPHPPEEHWVAGMSPQVKRSSSTGFGHLDPKRMFILSVSV